MEIIKALPFLEQYPNWIRLALAFWISSGGVLLALVLYFYSGADVIHKKEKAPCVLQSAYASGINSHYGATKNKLLSLDCARYRADAHVNLYTLERRICEALSELRKNMNLLTEIKESSRGFKKLHIKKLNIASTKSYIENDLVEEAYGPKKEKINELILSIESAIKSINAISSDPEFNNWVIHSPLTLDDLFISFGFLEWIIGYDSKDKAQVSPSEFGLFSPFFDKAFSKEEKSEVVVKEFLRDGEVHSDYMEILSDYD